MISTATGTTIFATAGAKLYRDATDVTPVGPTITASQVYWPIRGFSGDLIYTSDNDIASAKPFRVTNTSSTPVTGTNIEIDSAPSAWVARGPATIYGGKLFFVVASVGATTYDCRIAWSEEADVTTGYAQTGYTNYWDLFQSSTEQIRAIIGTNSALYYFRRNSIGSIRGAVSADFQTASTHDDVSRGVGIHDDSAPISAGGYVWFVDDQRRPWRFREGSSVLEPLWKQMRHRWSKAHVETGSIVAGGPQVVYGSDVGKVVFKLHPDASSSTRNLYVFDAITGSYEGRWLVGLSSQPASEEPTCVQIYTIGEGTSSTGDSVLCVGGTDAAGSENGHIWRQTDVILMDFGDGLSGSIADMHMSATTMLAPNDQVTEFRVDEIAIDAVPDNATLSLDYYTPRGSSTGLSLTGLGSSDSIQSSHDHGRYVAGLNARGTSFRAVMHWNVAASSEVGGVDPVIYAFERAILKVRGFTASPRAK